MWKYIKPKRFNKRYIISDEGVVMSNFFGHWEVRHLNKLPNGYLTIKLHAKGKKRENYYIHRLVGYYFVLNPNNYDQVLHNDNDRSNNHASNLRWGNQEQNVQQSYDDGRRKSPWAYKVEAFNKGY